MKQDRIIGIYLAAGKSKRMGKNKLTLPLMNDCLGSIALKTALQTELDHIIIITNPSDELSWITPSLKMNKKWCSFSCDDADKGQSHSLRFGIKNAIDLNANAVMILLADQPFISRKIINDLIFRYSTNKDNSIVAASFNGIPRPPILFSENLYPELLKLQGDKGARELLRRNIQDKKLIIEFQDRLSFLDVDHEMDYLSIRKLDSGREKD
ncbi:nucleotidyltransferase family protein [Heyndrickxia sp. NPDC080065]|uniref:nucleotidyltransferase family protein n=1 Tax=Heyndrickxia sp. NPDC080065 TaxID=3390568 RepID=UPI003D081686